ncbi:hypothetical protein LPJ59_002662 [Coemansia sp. RSA 2399]|nr:hypothetical protein LPJ59_002662 [Coemansia sp. RSA 2399]KAJ1904296.1 hypothetical protein LPJ81_002578 [Coemansia sp. IMI 209127]
MGFKSLSTAAAAAVPLALCLAVVTHGASAKNAVPEAPEAPVVAAAAVLIPSAISQQSTGHTRQPSAEAVGCSLAGQVRLCVNHSSMQRATCASDDLDCQCTWASKVTTCFAPCVSEKEFSDGMHVARGDQDAICSQAAKFGNLAKEKEKQKQFEKTAKPRKKDEAESTPTAPLKDLNDLNDSHDRATLSPSSPTAADAAGNMPPHAGRKDPSAAGPKHAVSPGSSSKNKGSAAKSGKGFTSGNEKNMVMSENAAAGGHHRPLVAAAAIVVAAALF